MSNAQLFIAAGLPTAASLASIAVALILNGRLDSRMSGMDARMSGLESRLDARMSGLGSRMDRMAADLSQFYLILGKHDKAIEMLERK